MAAYMAHTPAATILGVSEHPDPPEIGLRLCSRLAVSHPHRRQPRPETQFRCGMTMQSPIRHHHTTAPEQYSGVDRTPTPTANSTAWSSTTPGHAPSAATRC